MMGYLQDFFLSHILIFLHDSQSCCLLEPIAPSARAWWNFYHFKNHIIGLRVLIFIILSIHHLGVIALHISTPLGIYDGIIIMKISRDINMIGGTTTSSAAWGIASDGSKSADNIFFVPILASRTDCGFSSMYHTCLEVPP